MLVIVKENFLKKFIFVYVSPSSGSKISKLTPNFMALV